MDDRERAWARLAPEFRLGLRLSLAGLAITYALGIPLKCGGILPAHVTWLGLAVGPAALFGVLGSLFAALLLLHRRWWLLFVPVGVLCLAAVLGLIWLERG